MALRAVMCPDGRHDGRHSRQGRRDPVHSAAASAIPAAAARSPVIRPPTTLAADSWRAPSSTSRTDSYASVENVV